MGSRQKKQLFGALYVFTTGSIATIGSTGVEGGEGKREREL